MAYLGRGIENLSDRVVLDALTASATASYTLQLNSVNFVPSSASSLTVSLNGVIQKPDSSYTVSGSTLTFSSALTSSDSIDFIIAERGITLQTPSAGSVNTDQLAASAVTNAKIASDAAIATTKLGAGAIIQVVNDSDNANTVVSTTTYTDTGLTASITPNSTSNKILIMISQDFQLENTTATSSIIGGFKLLRDSTTLYTGSDDGNSFGVRHFGNGANNRGLNFVWSYQYYDTPSSTSSITYKTQCRTFDTNHRFRLNNQINGISKSFITLMEIAG